MESNFPGHIQPNNEVSSDSYSCDACNKSFPTQDLLRTHAEDHNATSSDGISEHKCDDCNYTSNSEENVLNHMIAKHSSYNCQKCEYVSKSLSELVSHTIEKHSQTPNTLTCRTCSQGFASRDDLNTHLLTHKKPDMVCCDYCGFKVKDLNTLDIHIKDFHKISTTYQNKDSRQTSQSPHTYLIHNTNRTPRKIFSSKERLDNGICRNWNSGICRFAHYCRYAHVKLCKFQDNCRDRDHCRFYHTNQSNLPFLSVVQPQSFEYRLQDFPILPPRGRRNL